MPPFNRSELDTAEEALVGRRRQPRLDMDAFANYQGDPEGNSSPKEALRWAQEAYDRWVAGGREGPVPINTQVYKVGGNGRVGFSEAFNPNFSWKDYAVALAPAGGMLAGAALAGGGAAAGAGSAAGASGLAATPATTAGLSALPGVAVPSAAGALGASSGAAGLLGVPAFTPYGASTGPVGLMGTPGITSTMAGGSGAGSVGFLSKYGPYADLIKDVGKAAGSASSAAAENRGTKAELLMDSSDLIEKQLLARELEKRNAQADAYKKAMYAANALQWKPVQRPKGVPVISFTSGPGKLGANAAGTLYKQVMSRLGAPDLKAQGGMPTYRPVTEDPEFKKTLSPGGWEKAGGVASVGLPVVSTILKLFGKK